MNILIIRESTTESVIQDGVTLFMLLTVILISYLLNSQVVGWFGAIMFFMTIGGGWFTRYRLVLSAEEASKTTDEYETALEDQEAYQALVKAG